MDISTSRAPVVQKSFTKASKEPRLFHEVGVHLDLLYIHTVILEHISVTIGFAVLAAQMRH